MYLIIITLMNNLITGLEALKQAFEELNAGHQEKVKELQDKIAILEKELTDARLGTASISNPGLEEAARIFSVLEPGRKIEQIKHIRAISGLGLLESKQLMERFNP